jgi:hypothetical protein
MRNAFAVNIAGDFGPIVGVINQFFTYTIRYINSNTTTPTFENEVISQNGVSSVTDTVTLL